MDQTSDQPLKIVLPKIEETPNGIRPKFSTNVYDTIEKDQKVARQEYLLQTDQKYPSFIELLSQSIYIYIDKFFYFSKILIVPVIITIILFILISQLLTSKLLVAIIIPLILIELWGQIAIFFAISNLPKQLSIKEVYLRALNKIPIFLYTVFIQALVSLGAAVSIILPGLIIVYLIVFAGLAFFHLPENILVGVVTVASIVLYVPLITITLLTLFTPFIVFSQSDRGFAALKKSRFYIQNYGLTVFGHFFLIIMISGLVQTAITYFSTKITSPEIIQIIYGVFILISAPLLIIFSQQSFLNLVELKKDIPYVPSVKFGRLIKIFAIFGGIELVSIGLLLFFSSVILPFFTIPTGLGPLLYGRR